MEASLPSGGGAAVPARPTVAPAAAAAGPPAARAAVGGGGGAGAGGAHGLPAHRRLLRLLLGRSEFLVSVTVRLPQQGCRLALSPVVGAFFSFIAQNFSMSLLACLMLNLAAQGHVLAERLRAARDSRDLHECVRHHQAFLRCVSEMQGLVGHFALAQFASSLIVICISLFNATKESGVVVQGLYVAMVPPFLLDVLLLSEMGEQVTTSGQTLSLAIYESPWLDAPLRMRRELITVLMRSQRDLRLSTAGGFADLSRETFLSVLRSSYSLYTLLLTVNE